MRNLVIDNVLSKDQIKRLIKKANQYAIDLPTFVGDFDKDGDKTKLTKIINKFTGRLSIHCFDLDNDIVESFLNSLELNGFKGYKYMNSTSYLEYDLKYGNPKLPVHKDKPIGVDHIVVDYQLNHNVDWPIMIEETKYPMLDNSMLVFNSLDQYHSRPKITFNDGEFVKVLMIRFDKLGN
jgi:hypothetical protein